MLQYILTPSSQASTAGAFATFLEQAGPAILVLGWAIVIFLTLTIAWAAYMLLKQIDYVTSVQWTFLQILVPEDSEETPKSMEIFYDIMGGLHKGPDIVERYFDGYQEAWYSCEIHFLPNQVRYIMVVPTAHRQFVEGAIYGQYPKAQVVEVDDYTQRFNWKDIRRTFDLYGSEIVFAKADIYPIKSYRDFESVLAEEDKYVDPHQVMIEALSNINEGEEYWYQLVIRPMDAGDIADVTVAGEKEVSKIASRQSKKTISITGELWSFLKSFPLEVLRTGLNIMGDGSEKEEPKQPNVYTPVEDARMKGITLKVSQNLFKAKIRVMYIAPKGKVVKPNISRLVGTFKQFNTSHLNALKPDPNTKTNGPSFWMKDARRALRERKIFLTYQWRDFFGVQSGQWYSAEELATLYHFPMKYVRAPSVQRSKAGSQTPPENLPYA